MNRQIRKNFNKVLSDFQKDPRKVFYDTMDNLIQNSYVYKVDKQDVLKYLKEKIQELE